MVATSWALWQRAPGLVNNNNDDGVHGCIHAPLSESVQSASEREASETAAGEGDLIKPCYLY